MGSQKFVVFLPKLHTCSVDFESVAEVFHDLLPMEIREPSRVELEGLLSTTHEYLVTPINQSLKGLWSVLRSPKSRRAEKLVDEVMNEALEKMRKVREAQDIVAQLIQFYRENPKMPFLALRKSDGEVIFDLSPVNPNSDYKHLADSIRNN